MRFRSNMPLIVLSLIMMTMASVGAPRRCSAQVPSYLPIRGFLTAPDGSPINDTLSIRFRIYDTADPAGATGEVLFEENVPEVNVVDGAFFVYLGDTKSLDLSLFGQHSELFVGILVEGDTKELSPLHQLGTVPFSARAQSCGEADTLQGKSASDFLTSDYAPAWSAIVDKPDGINELVSGVIPAARVDSYTKSEADERYLNFSQCYWKSVPCPDNPPDGPTKTCVALCDPDEFAVSGGCAANAGSAIRENMPNYGTASDNGRWAADEMNGWYCRTSQGQMLEMRIMCCRKSN